MKAFIFVFVTCLVTFLYIASSAQTRPAAESYIKYDDTRSISWSSEVELVDIPSSGDGQLQKAYFYKTRSVDPQPLIISLHTWSGDYSQKDELLPLCQQKNLNYIHPDFRGANKTPAACCSELALSDIDDAISFACRQANVDTSKIYVIGVSGGGYATLSTFMKSRHRIRKFSAWASITDLEAWYRESTIRKAKYAADILACTDSKRSLNLESAQRRSPLYMPTPLSKIAQTQLFIYAGAYDGIQGSVPITHSINFYNKLLTSLSVTDRSLYVSDHEKLRLLEFQQPLGPLGQIAGRTIYLKKQYQNVNLTIFEGDHEMLPEYALNALLNE